MSEELVPNQEVVAEFEREFKRTGEVVLTPSKVRIVGGQLPALLALPLGAWFVTQAVADGGLAMWIWSILTIAAGLFGCWQLYLGLWGPGGHPVRVSADGLHDEATGGRLAWIDITDIEIGERTVNGLTLGRWVVLEVPPAAVRSWSGETSTVGGFVQDLREDFDTRVGGSSRIQLPASLPDPVSIRKWLRDELRRREQQ